MVVGYVMNLISFNLERWVEGIDMHMCDVDGWNRELKKKGHVP